MLSKVLAAAALLSAASAAPFDIGGAPLAQLWTPSAIPDGTLFTLQADDTFNVIRYTLAKAAARSIYFGGPPATADCDGGDNDGVAVFYVQGGGLYLYTPGGQPLERLWTNRTPAGQGLLLYSGGNEQLPRGAENVGFAIDATAQLTFDGSGFLACPTGDDDDAWTLWVGVGIDNPQGNEGCVGVLPHAVVAQDPHACVYSGTGTL